MRNFSDPLLELAPEGVRKAALNALAFAEEAHAGQIRPGGEPQIHHVVRVVGLALVTGQLESLDDAAFAGLVAAAALHDVLEDTSCTDDVLAAQFGGEVARVVRAVSHVAEEESDETYLSRVHAGGRLAVLVKRCDRLDNLGSLASAPKNFRDVKLAEVEAALPIWRRIDPQGATLIESLLRELQRG